MTKLTHLDEHGQASMVDIAGKVDTDRTAIACGSISMREETLELVTKGNTPKGDVLTVARIAGIMATKKTSDLIPLCHNINLSSVSVSFKVNSSKKYVHCKANVTTTGQTGVEMEALTAVQIGLLTIYDMCKSMDKRIKITDLVLIEKRGGSSGDFVR